MIYVSYPFNDREAAVKFSEENERRGFHSLFTEDAPDSPEWARQLARGLGRRGSKVNPGYLPVSVELLAQMLETAQEEHKTWEAENGPDPHWPTWYAKHLLGLDVTPAETEEVAA